MLLCAARPAKHRISARAQDCAGRRELGAFPWTLRSSAPRAKKARARADRGRRRASEQSGASQSATPPRPRNPNRINRCFHETAVKRRLRPALRLAQRARASRIVLGRAAAGAPSAAPGATVEAVVQSSIRRGRVGARHGTDREVRVTSWENSLASRMRTAILRGRSARRSVRAMRRGPTRESASCVARTRCGGCASSCAPNRRDRRIMGL